jgi:Immunity protein 21
MPVLRATLRTKPIGYCAAVNPVPLDPEAIRLSRLVTFAESKGGPLIVMSESAAPSWLGVYDSTGNAIFGKSPCDYDRACAASVGLIDVGQTQALTLETPDNSAFVPRPEGALIVRWVGADGADALISAALAVSDEQFTESVGDLAHDGGKLLMFDSAARGTALDPRSASIDLPAGVYAVRLCTEWEGQVLGADGESQDVMVQVLELRRS